MAKKSSAIREKDSRLEAPEEDLQEAQQTLKKMEAQSGGSARIKVDTDEQRKHHIDEQEYFKNKVTKGGAGSVLFICTAFLVAVIGLMFVSPMVLLINNKEQLVNDLNDGFLAYNTYTNKVLGMQLEGGCSQETIECKFKTMSPMLKKRFEKYGFQVLGSEVKATKRYNVATIVHPTNQKYAKLATAKNEMLLKMARQDSAVNTVLDKIYSSRTGVYQDQKFYQRLQERFGLSQAHTLSGDTVSQYDEEFDKRVKYGDSWRYADATDQEEGDTLDANGRGTYSLGSLVDLSDRYTVDIYRNLADKANTHLALACSFATYGHLTENSLRRAKETTIARFAMNYLSLADAIKAGNDTGEYEVAVESLAGKLMHVGSDERNAMDGSSYRTPAMGESPDDRMAMMQQLSPLLALAILKPGVPSMPGSEYLKGATLAVQNSAPEKTPDGLCRHGMAGAQNGTEQGGLCYSPASLPLASFVGAIAAGIVAPLQYPIERFICPGSVKAVVEIVKNASSAEIPLLAGRLKLLANNEAGKFPASLTGVDAQNVIFAGAGTILGDRAQSLGMRPASHLSFIEYNKLAQVERSKLEEQDKVLARATPWDATNPHSFLGTIVSKFAPAGSTLPGRSLLVNTSSILSLIPASLTTAAETSASALYTQPMHFKPERLGMASMCGIGNPGELDGKIAPDIGCNIRYSMSLMELNADLHQVIDYMTKSHSDNAQESLSQTTSRDTGADATRGATMKQQAQEGASAAYVDKKTGKPNNYTEYAKFLEYCVNRADPWGGKGMVVQPKEEEAGETNSLQSSISAWPETDKPDEKNVAESYYALGWGGATDQDWYTGKRCVDDDPRYAEMLKNFRAYTMACGILADLSGSVECWDEDKDLEGHDDFYTSNNIIFISPDAP